MLPLIAGATWTGATGAGSGSAFLQATSVTPSRPQQAKRMHVCMTGTYSQKPDVDASSFLVLGPWFLVLGPFLVRGPSMVRGPRGERTEDLGRTKDQGPGTDQGRRTKNQGPYKVPVSVCSAASATR